VDPLKSRMFLYSYHPDEKTFHIVVMLKNRPGALSSVLGLLSDRVNLMSSTTYDVDPDNAVWSAFAKALAADEERASLEGLLGKSAFVLEATVTDSDEGLLVDGFHSGFEDNRGLARTIMTRSGLSSTFDRLVSVFGTGGSTVLYEEGRGLGISNAQGVIRLMGPSLARAKTRRMYKVWGPMGWGNAQFSEGPDGVYALKVEDCFECSSRGKVRTQCDWMRGHITGYLSTIFGSQLECKETACRFRGDTLCEFALSKGA